MAGRKTKLTKQLIDEAEKLIKAGNYITTVCDYLGISHDTWYRWLREGEEEKKGLKSEFSDRVRQAESESEIRMVMQWQQQMPESWTAIKEFLERRFPSRWGKKDNLQVDHKGKIEIDGIKDQLLERVERLQDDEDV